MNYDVVNESNFTLFAARHYDNPQCTDDEEFYDDLKRFKYIKRLLNRYESDDDLKERLILNHLTVLFNVFGDAAVPMLFLKIDPTQYHLIKPFLVLLNRMPRVVTGVHSPTHKIFDCDIMMDDTIIQRLRKV